MSRVLFLSSAFLVLMAAVVFVLPAFEFADTVEPPLRQPSLPDEPAMVPAQPSGQVTAPTGRYSDWLTMPRDRCLRWRVEEPGAAAKGVRTRFMDWSGDVWSGSSAGKDVQARSWQSQADDPVRIAYELVPRASDGKCAAF
jgi:hypothetical protein